jgi:hypothetical protein
VSDRDWRSWERRLHTNPDDQDALHRAIVARQRSGLPVPGWMHARRLFGPRRFASLHRLDVSVLLPDGRQQGVGRTPSDDAAGLALPEHCTFWVKPAAPTDGSLAAAIDALTAESVPGLALGADVTDAGLAHLERLAGHLTWLDLSACGRVTAAGLARLLPLGALATLKLWHCAGLDDEGLAHLGHLRGLSTLDLSQCGGVTDSGLRHLSSLAELASLSLGGCARVTDAGLAHLRTLPRLASLDLRRCAGLTDAGLRLLAELPELTVLNLSGCPNLTPAGLQALTELPHLSQLYVVGCGLEEARVFEALRPLADRCEVAI